MIHHTGHWVVEHTVGPLGLGTLIVKPKRHVTAVADLSDSEAAELGPLLREASMVASELVDSQQVYNCLWSHAGGVPTHIHFVIQPVTAVQMEAHDSYGPRLQVAMFEAEEAPATTAIEEIADRARQLFSTRARSATAG